MGGWSSGMIPVLGTGGPGFNSRTSPFLFIPCKLISELEIPSGASPISSGRLRMKNAIGNIDIVNIRLPIATNANRQFQRLINN